jgi:AmmeMemoRadiSam system protein B/AmmeMemoRadiSam system protein A
MKRAILFMLTSLLLLQSGCRAGSESSGPVRAPAVAGQFYPADAEKLRQAISSFLDDAVPSRGEKPIALIAPHAGYVYCGQLMADAYRQAQGQRYDVVFILGTNHTTPGFRGVSVYSKGGFRTPLGVARIDEESAARILASDPAFAFEPRVHEREHSVEVQVPWVQQVLPGVPIVPMIVGDPDPDLCTRLGRAIAEASKGRSALVVASSDLSHYPEHDDACAVDKQTLKSVVSLDPAQVHSAARSEMALGVPNLQTCACGEAPIMAAMAAAKALGATHGIALSYANSGDALVGEYDRVVGYGAVMLSAGAATPDTTALQRPAITAMEVSLSPADKKALLAFARKSVEWYLKVDMTPLPRGFSSAAQTPAGAFVTLKKRGELRGCIGHMAEDMPLCRTVGAMALAAAFDDQRFRPVQSAELDDLEFEISMLTPARPVPDAGSIVVGRDGVVIRKSGRSAVFLPQVAPEQGWTRDQMLENLCRKAGLPSDAWKSGAQFSTFQAVVFSESEH